MKSLSLTTRLSLMFMFVVTAVLTVGGFSFNYLCQQHFNSLDEHTLLEKLQTSQSILGKLPGIEAFDELKPQLQALLGTNQDLTATISDSSGKVLFAHPAAMNIPERFRDFASRRVWDWQNQEQMFRGMTAQVAVAGQEKPMTVIIALNVTDNMFLFETLKWWLWIGLLICALVCAGLGWIVAHSGLRPLDQVTRAAASISANSLKERIPMVSIPVELRQLVSSFNAMLARLDDAFGRLSNYSADIAHELRTPVSNLMTHTEVVLSKKRNVEEYEENLYLNLEDFKRMSRMIDDMLFLAKADNGLITPEREWIALEGVVDTLLEYYGLLADERGIELELSGCGSVQGDALMLHRAISNLLSNALRYTPQGKTIRVQLSRSDTSTVLTVENPGETIPPEHLDKLFDRFYRVHPTRREGSPSNAGLGLAIIRSIIEAHQGKVWCTSANGWTAFHLEFPAP
ncbi:MULTISPECIES: heavy metal sensor histidine kinase [unclassified Pseudomonas]|uniref:heavy metal sensor histidine kinase n=1 Tax=unclassified Pseudomonas TaxID=196821 RepID=UPI000C86A039|nr:MULTISPECIES: heavy metal sensor histidine kinase [unclassified Pseudomonas]PMU22976.1 two-component sensor histidine kinase [Pseudomonas sp. GP01-A9]PMU28558.1 two-component sensor histidine kinase [Pseudomonas sp. GP01-A13]PMU38810.1 two-component sensor histidine kinase [Pseudomonas sp. GP01-A8]PMU52428.1 two-component sensor histidine kinase [Pseudomonas sp. GP01-A6]PMU54425.1 two-component sensor histidine kinase [Pseudomonas sp. GP01-A14]